MHHGVRRPDPRATSYPLLSQGVGPWQVEMYDYAGVLQVHPFGQQVGGKQQADGAVRRRWRAFLRQRCEAGERLAAGDTSTGNARVPAGEQAHAGNVRQRAMQGADGVRELREGDDGRVGVRREQRAQGIGARRVSARRSRMVLGELCQRREVRLDAFDERSALHFVPGHEFGEGELHLVIAHEPAAQLRLRGMTTGAQRVQQRVTTQSSLTQGVIEGRVAAAPGTQQPEPDQRAGHGAIVGRQRGGECENMRERGAIVRHGQWSMLLHLRSRYAGRRR